jgi:ribonucleoside-diphosphate reductase alpha chain
MTTQQSDSVRELIERNTTEIGDEATEGLIEATHRNVYDGASLDEVYDAAVSAATARTKKAPEYDDAAASPLLESYHNEVTGGYDDIETAYRESLVEAVERGVEYDLLDERMETYDLDALADELAPKRDDLLDYTAVKTLYQRYFLRTNEAERLELPQVFWMRIPMASERAAEFADEAQEFVAYHAVLASSRLAAERGAYESFEGSKWDRGLLPLDNVDLLEEERGRRVWTGR